VAPGRRAAVPAQHKRATFCGMSWCEVAP
jgi:hypothetical protein